MISKFLPLFAAVLWIAACSDQKGGDGSFDGNSNIGRMGGVTSDALGGVSGNRGQQFAQAQSEWQNQFVASGIDRVFFSLDQYTLSADSQNILRQQAAFLQKYPLVNFKIEGHADERGTREYNLALGDRRSQSVHEYLSSLGISSNRLQGISYGKERPAAIGRGEAVWAKNRRVVSTPN